MSAGASDATYQAVLNDGNIDYNQTLYNATIGGISGLFGGLANNCLADKSDDESETNSKLALLTGEVKADAACAVHGNSKNSNKTQHGYKIIDNNSGKILEYGISGQPLNTNGTSPRIKQKINVKYNGNTNVSGEVLETNIPNRQAALDWETDQVLQYKAGNNGVKPINQIKPNP